MYPYTSPNQQAGFGFSNSTKRLGEEPGYPLLQGGGFPCPPDQAYPQVPNINPSYPPSATGYIPPQQFPSSYPANEYGASAFGTVPFSADSSSSMYPPTQNPAFSNPSYLSQYPSPGAAAPYPPNVGSNMPYPPSSSPNMAYPPNSRSAMPYPPNPGTAVPYPPNVGSTHSTNSAYPPNVSPSPFSSDSVRYPPAGAYSSSSPYSVPHSPQPPYQPTESHGYALKSSVSSPSSYSSGPLSHQTSSYPSAQNDKSTGALWSYQERPTVRPALQFDPSSDASVLRKAMKGFGTDEKAIIAVLGRRTADQRQQIVLKYQQAYGKDLIKDLKSELGGRFEYSVLALMSPIHDFLAQELSNAIRGAGTNERTLIEILCSADNQMIRSIKSVYARKFNRPLEADLRGDLSGDVQHILIAVSTGSRDENNYDTSVAPQLAQSLYNAGVKKKSGTDESEFIRILSCYSYPVLRCVFSEYAKITGKTLESSIVSETSGHFKTGLLALHAVVNNRAAFLAKELHDAMKGLGTKDNSLVRIIVSRSEIDMGNIKDEYHKMFGRRLEDVISGDTSGDYKSLLLTLIQG